MREMPVSELARLSERFLDGGLERLESAISCR
jgi:hypothetical protein